MNAPFLERAGIILTQDESLISSVFALNVTPKKQIFLFFKLLFNNLSILFVNNFDRFSFDFITDLINDKFVFGWRLLSDASGSDLGGEFRAHGLDKQVHFLRA